MLVVLSDTHALDGSSLVGAAADAVENADLVLHAGDFTTEAVLDSFYDGTDDFRAVHGNADSPAVTERLPEATVLEYEGVRIAATHRRRGGDTGLGMFGRERGADLVVSGHTHRPRVEAAGEVTLLNPGSHADPRGARQSFAVLEPQEGGLSGELRTVGGETFAQFTVEK
ncbi:metallophosphoesterase [Halolamina litorea]|uniref:Phosphoesterase n=1 Tax=Halolamina litorea TaxID=1515593 RepID=A0ABD6BS51_9EURY|nr:metallophosphoesterase [Halolamina litorea]